MGLLRLKKIGRGAAITTVPGEALISMIRLVTIYYVWPQSVIRFATPLFQYLVRGKVCLPYDLVRPRGW